MKITCIRPNASEEISGIPFARQNDGSVVATGVSPEDAAMFEGIEGYSVEEEQIEPPAKPPAEPPADNVAKPNNK